MRRGTASIILLTRLFCENTSLSHFQNFFRAFLDRHPTSFFFIHWNNLKSLSNTLGVGLNTCISTFISLIKKKCFRVFGPTTACKSKENLAQQNIRYSFSTFYRKQNLIFLKHMQPSLYVKRSLPGRSSVVIIILLKSQFISWKKSTTFWHVLVTMNGEIRNLFFLCWIKILLICLSCSKGEECWGLKMIISFTEPFSDATQPKQTARL